MTREQGLEIIEALFVYEPDFCYHGLKFFFIAPDGTHVSYLDGQFLTLIAFSIVENSA